MILALALIHHLSISNNVPLPEVSKFMSQLAEWLIIEFVPKEDHKVKKLLATREDIFPTYTKDGFEAAFSTDFKIEHVEQVQNTQRRLYLMRRLEGI